MDLSLNNKYLTVDNYKEILEVSNEEINLLKLKVLGSNLSIKYLDKNTIVISGIIKQLLIKDESK